MMRFRSSTSGGTIEKSAARRAECSTCVTLGTGRPSTRYRCRSGSNVKSTPTLLALHETAEHVVLAAVVSQYCDAGHRLMPLPAGNLRRHSGLVGVDSGHRAVAAHREHHVLDTLGRTPNRVAGAVGLEWADNALHSYYVVLAVSRARVLGAFLRATVRRIWLSGRPVLLDRLRFPLRLTDRGLTRRRGAANRWGQPSLRLRHGRKRPLFFLDPHLAVLVANRCLHQRHVLARQAQPLRHATDRTLLDHLVLKPPPWAPRFAGRLRALLDLLDLLAGHPLKVGAPVAKLHDRVGADPIAPLRNVKQRHVGELPPGAQLQRELVALVDDGRKDARHLPGPVGQSNKAAVADEELALQDVVGFLVSTRHQVGVAQLVAEHQAKLGNFENRLDDT